jgi:hypothetical protein
MSMNFRDKAIFKISRNEVGDCTLELRRHILWVFPYWFSLFTCPIHFLECLGFIKDWCCERNIGTAVIYDPQGVNPKMTIKYRRYKGEKLNKV